MLSTTRVNTYLLHIKEYYFSLDLLTRYLPAPGKAAKDNLLSKPVAMPPGPHIIPGRVVVYAKDVENITGRHERAARKILQNIREKFGKPKNGFVTFREFSLYTGIDEDLIREFLID